MTNPATTTDVENRWRPLSTQETTNAETFLDDAWVMLKRHMTRLGVDIETDMATDDDLAADVVRVLATAVKRVLVNPDGLTDEAEDDYSWSRADDEHAGVLYFTDAELDGLLDGSGETGRAFTVDLLADYATRIAE